MESKFNLLQIPGFKKVIIDGSYNKIRSGLLKIAQFPEKPFVFKNIKLSRWGNGEVIRIGYKQEGNSSLIEDGTILFLVNNLQEEQVELAFKCVSSNMEKRLLLSINS